MSGNQSAQPVTLPDVATADVPQKVADALAGDPSSVVVTKKSPGLWDVTRNP